MSELTVVRGPGKGSSVALSPDLGVTIGTGGDADIRVGGDGIAAAHVVVKALKGGGFGAKGLAGPFQLNGDATEVARLNDGDVMRIGDSEIRFAKTATTPTDELAGYRLLGVLGRGGWGIVYRAEQISLSREVALKVLSKERLDDPLFVGRFQAEARAAARLHHPNVVQVFDVDHDGDRWFYSMELMPGGSLEQRLKRDGRLPIDEVLRAIGDAARGLAFAEQMQIVHRDIKPDNLMVDRHGHVKIADLGLASTDDDGESKLVGTPHFMSPEQVRRLPLDHRSDLYALGCTFYRLATGRTPFQADSVKQILRAQLDEEPTPAHEVTPEIPVGVGEVIQRLMRKDPDDRYQSAKDLLQDLETLLAPPAKRSGWLALVAAVALIAAVVAVVLALNRDDPNSGTPATQTEYVVDPEAQKAIEENRRIEAENALLRVRTQGLAGAALADALETVAREHADTPAAEQATSRAARIREDLRLSAEADARRRAAIQAAIDSLRSAFDRAMQDGDLLAAAGALAGPPQSPEITDAPQLAETRDELDRQLQAAVTARIASFKDAVDAAISARDPAAVRAALAPLDSVLVPGAWPDAMLPGRAELNTYAADARARAATIEGELAEAAQSGAWADLRTAVLADDGIAAQIVDLRLRDAAVRLEQLAAEHAGFGAGTRAAELVRGLRAAESYLASYRAAVAGGGLEVVDPRSGEPVPIVALGDAGLTIRGGPKTRPKDERIATVDLLTHAPAWFIELPAAPRESRAAFLGTLAIARHLRAASEYLTRLRADQDDTGTGDQAYALPHGSIEAALDGLRAVDEDWARAISAELEATSLVARSLSALSARRNLTAASLAERLMAESAGTMVVRCLR